MVNVYGSSESTWFNLNPGDVSICSRMYWQVLDLICPYVKPHMVMVGPKLTKVAAKADRNIQWIPEIATGIIIFLKNLGISKKTVYQECDDYDHSHES
jgi:hypothetical protein